MNNVNINIDELKGWIGNEEVAYDEVSVSLEKRFRATIVRWPPQEYIGLLPLQLSNHLF